MRACGDVDASKLQGHIYCGVPILRSSNEAVKIDGDRVAKNPACTLKTHPRYLQKVFIAVPGFVHSFWKRVCAADRDMSPFFCHPSAKTRGMETKWRQRAFVHKQKNLWLFVKTQKNLVCC